MIDEIIRLGIHCVGGHEQVIVVGQEGVTAISIFDEGIVIEGRYANGSFRTHIPICNLIAYSYQTARMRDER